eukprot:7863138-Pyramimonas_sp.AAC.1
MKSGRRLAKLISMETGGSKKKVCGEESEFQSAPVQANTQVMTIIETLKTGTKRLMHQHNARMAD